MIDKAPVTVEQGDREAAISAILKDLRGRRLLKYLFDSEPENCGPYGYIDTPIDLETQREIVGAWVDLTFSARLQSTAALEEEIAKYRTLLARWVEWSCGQQGPSPFQDTRTALEGRGS